MASEWEAQRAQDEQEMQARINRFVNNLPSGYSTPRRVYHAAKEAAEHYGYTGAALQRFAETAEARYRAGVARARTMQALETLPTATLIRIARRLSRKWPRTPAPDAQQHGWHALSLIAEEVEQRTDSPLPLFYARLLAAREARALGREYVALHANWNDHELLALGWELGDQRIRAGTHTALEAPTYRAFFAQQFTRSYQRARRAL